MLSFSNLSDRCTQLRQMIGCLAMQALVHRHPKLVCDSICHIELMQLRVTICGRVMSDVVCNFKMAAAVAQYYFRFRI